ncbi:hypothetical protein [Bradyrhizobium erythrophlei]|uniref:hypothetical protein n=1 Tax=Bradyrhizobium erythrophlei TaxID=1437360 RepID=UPI0009A7C2A0|nr:hypothetical protein [Bradyrhizobium erythrophlei]
MTSGKPDLRNLPPALAECEKVAKKVALPPIAPGMDKVAVIARYRSALITANNRIEGASECLAEIDALQTGNQK